MSEGDWRDAFGDDEAARERERRRAEREARRRERRRQLADRVREQGEGEAPKAPPPGAATPPDSGPAPEPSADPPGQAVPEPPAAEPKPPIPEPAGPPRPPAAKPPPRRDPAELLPPRIADRPDPAFEGLHGDLPEETAVGDASDFDELADDEQPLPRRRAFGGSRRGAGAPSGAILKRRLLAIGLLAAAVGLVGFGAASVADRIGGGDPPPPPPAEAPTISVTIPEGADRRQIAEIAADAGLRGNYEQASREARGFNPGRYGAEDPESLEGFLFPATYELHENDRVQALIERQLEAFEERIGEVNMNAAEQRGRSVYDVLNIAAMIEREVQIPRERRLVSAVIHNRLDAGNPLGIDATIRYEDENYDEPLTESRLAEPTPYNTRVHAGLPPTPIGNPGIEAIRAAANPADTNDFYYVVEPYTCGEHFFTESEAEFHQKQAEYQAALEAEGGAPTPEDC